MNSLKQRFYLALITFSVLSNAYGDVSYTDPSVTYFPEGKSNGTVNYQGDLVWSENVMTVPGRNGLSFDLNLAYKSGILVEQESSWVGLGWNLSLGCVTRAVVNYPDERDNGFFGRGEEEDLIPDPMFPGRDYIFDCHDRFYLVLPEGGGQVILAEPCPQGTGVNGGQINDIDIEFKCAEWNAWRIIAHTSYQSGSGDPRYIEKFTVITDDGTTYIFDAICWSKAAEIQSYVEVFEVGDEPSPPIWQVTEYFYGHPFQDECEEWYGDTWHYSYEGKKAPYFWGLTAILSPDYYDTTGNGLTEDDKGSWIKIDYDYPVGTGLDYALEFMTRFHFYCGGDYIYTKSMGDSKDSTGELDKGVLGYKTLEVIPNADPAAEEPAALGGGSGFRLLDDGIETDGEVGVGLEAVTGDLTGDERTSGLPGVESLGIRLIKSGSDAADEALKNRESEGTSVVGKNRDRDSTRDGYYTPYCFRKTITRMNFAVPYKIETPTHVAYFDTSEKELADCVATDTVNYYGEGVRHLYKLDNITLKSKIQSEEEVCTVDFDYYTNSVNPETNESLCYDEHPVTENYEDFMGGKLTLKSVKHFNYDGGALPGYYYDYCSSSDYCNPDLRWSYVQCQDDLGYYTSYNENVAWNLRAMYLPTGAKLAFEYEYDYASFWQNTDYPPDPDPYNTDPLWAYYGGGRIKTITAYTGVNPGDFPYYIEDPHSETRITHYEYQSGCILDVSVSPKKYCPAGIMHRENYIGYGSIKSYTEIRDYWGAKWDYPSYWPDTAPVTRFFTTARLYPDPAKVTDDFVPNDPYNPTDGFVQIVSFEWMRGHQYKVFGPYTTFGYFYDFPTYDENNGAYEHPKNCPGLMDEYNEEVYDYYIYDGPEIVKAYRVQYHPGWPRLASKKSVIDGTEYGEEYDFDYYEDHEYYKANGRPNEIRTYRELGGSALSAYRGAGDQMRETARGLAGSVVNIIYNNVTEGRTDEDTGESLFSIICGKAGNILSGMMNTLEGMELVTTTEITYAYEKGYEASPPDVYVQMGPDYKNILSHKYQVTTYDELNSHDKVSDTITEYDEFGNYDQIHPSESKRWLKYGMSSRWVTSTFVDYDDYGNLIEVEDPLGRTTSSTYPVDYKYSVPTSITNAKGHTTSLNYDTRFVHITDITDPNDLKTYYEYDKFGRLTDIYYPNNPPSSGQPSVEYTYHWAPERYPGDPFGNNAPSDFCYIKTETLVEHGTPPEKRISTQFYNGLGENFRTVVQTGDNYLDGLYSDTYCDASGKVVVSHIPYEADSWDDALPLPFLLAYNYEDNHEAHDGDLYVPYYETIYDYKGGVTDRPMVVFRPSKTCSGGLNRLGAFGSGNQLFESAIRYESEEEEGRTLKTVLSTDGAKREIKDYYDERGNHLERKENRGASSLEFTRSGVDTGYITGITWISYCNYPINTSYSYDALNRLTDVTDARDFSHTFSYDSFGRLREATDPDRGTTWYGYDDVGNLTVFKDAELSPDHTVHYHYDELNRITEEILSTEFRGIGETGPGKEPTFTADLDVFGADIGLYNNSMNLGTLWAGLPPDCGADGHFNPLNYTTGTMVEYIYDEVDSWNEPIGPSLSEGRGDPVWDGKYYGKLLRVVDKIGRKDFMYDNMGRITSILDDRCYFDHNEYTHKYEYNKIGDLVSETYPSELEVTYEYDKAGRLINIPGFYGESAVSGMLGFGDEQTPAGSERYFGTDRSSIRERMYPSLLARKRTMDADPDYSFDMMCKGISPTLNQVLDGFIYDEDFNRLEHICPNNGTNTKYYVDERQVVYDVHYNIYEERPSGNPQLMYYYHYDDSLQVIDISDNLFEKEIAGDACRRLRTFTYNEMNRLTEVLGQWEKTTPVDFYHVSYDYDELGNRIGIDDVYGSEYYSLTYDDDSNQLEVDHEGYGYSYDNRGAITGKALGDYDVYYEYDYAGRLTALGIPPENPPNSAFTLSGTDDAVSEPVDSKRVSSGTSTPYGGTSDSSSKLTRDGAGTGSSEPASFNDKACTSESESRDDPVPSHKIWTFTYDGGGARIYKRGPDSASKYIYDATGRLITEVSNDFTKSSANKAKNAGFEVFNDFGIMRGGKGPENGVIVTPGPADVPVGSMGITSEEKAPTEDVAESAEKGGVNSVDDTDFVEWENVNPGGTSGDISAYNYWDNDDDNGPEGATGIEIERTSATGSLYVYQEIDIVPDRTYELRFWAKQEGLESGGACVKLGVEDGINALTGITPENEVGAAVLETDGEGTLRSPVYDQELRSEDILSSEWTEYRMPFAIDDEYDEVTIALEVEEGDTGSVYFDRVTVSEYLNDPANSSFEDYMEYGPPGGPYGADFDEWEEERTADEQIQVGEGILSDACAVFNWPSSSPPQNLHLQQNCLLVGETHEVSFYAKTTGNAYILCQAVWGEDLHDIVVLPGETVDDWTRFVGYYTTPEDDPVPPPPGVRGEGATDNDIPYTRAIRIGATGGPAGGSVYVDDITCKPVPDMTGNGDMEDYYYEPKSGGRDAGDIDFIAWEEGKPEDADIDADVTDPYMNEASAEFERDEADDYRSLPATLFQEFSCLPGTEYEITVAYKIGEDFEQPQGAYYGAFCFVGDEIISPFLGTSPTEYLEYDGEFIEVVNDRDPNDEWLLVSKTYKVSGDKIQILLGLGQGCEGDCWFDSVVIRDLTTKRYEYIYGKGRKLAKIEYEGDVLEAQVYYYHNDLLGSPICVTDIDGSVVWKGDYLPFGEPLQDIDTVYWGNAYTYLGNEDDGGLMYFHARYYAKELGRFMSCDPIKDMASSALTINPYVYCGNNPIVFKDPLGLRQPPAPSWGDEESGGGGGGTSRGFWEGQGFDTWGGGNPYTPGCVIQSAAGPDISNSFVQILLFAISLPGIAEDLYLYFEEAGYTVDKAGYGITTDLELEIHSGSMTQEKFHDTLSDMPEDYEILYIVGHNPGSGEGKPTGLIFDNYSKKFDAELAKNQKLPVIKGGSVVLDICYSGKYGPVDTLSGFRNWIKNGAGIEKLKTSDKAIVHPIATDYAMNLHIGDEYFTTVPHKQLIPKINWDNSFIELWDFVEEELSD